MRKSFKNVPAVFSVLILLISNPDKAEALQPGKWSHTDDLVSGMSAKLPKELHALNPAGKLLQKAVFEYNPGNRLIRETYYNDKGEHTGHTEFNYTPDNRLESEVLMDKSGKVLGRRVFRYKENWLHAVDIFDESGNKIITQRYRNDGKMIIGGEEISGDAADRFSLSYDNGKLKTVQVYGPDKGILNEVVYVYNDAGLLSERIRKQGSSESLCRYEYSNNSLKSFTYFSKVNGKWEMDKKLIFVY